MSGRGRWMDFFFPQSKTSLKCFDRYNYANIQHEMALKIHTHHNDNCRQIIFQKSVLLIGFPRPQLCCSPKNAVIWLLHRQIKQLLMCICSFFLDQTMDHFLHTLTCQGRKSTGVINNIKSGSALSKRLIKLWQCDCEPAGTIPGPPNWGR